jgi:anti-sigma regulatory factor (Ser/Thr protein kinase)
MEIDSLSVPVTEPSAVLAARRAAVACARRLQFDETDMGRVALVATEMATNVLKHGGGGEIVVRNASGANGEPAVEVLALDRGPGMNAAVCMTDGYSTTQTPGLGLGAVRRASAMFDVYSQPQKGTALVSRVIASGARRSLASTAPVIAEVRELLQGRFDVSGISVARRGETECGDGWSFKSVRTGGALIVADGLGHGPLAAAAARAALGIFDTDTTAANLTELMTRLHEALRPTRGAAIAIANIDRQTQVLRYCGIGNIAGAIVSPAGTRRLVSQNGTAGHEMRRLQEFSAPWTPDSMLLLHSDGIATHWRLEDYPGLAAHSPALVAGVLYRDFNRGRDDATVAVVRGR